MNGSRKSSLTSFLVLLVACCIVVMQLYNFFTTGAVLDIFTTLSSMVLGAYFQKSITKEE